MHCMPSALFRGFRAFLREYSALAKLSWFACLFRRFFGCFFFSFFSWVANIQQKPLTNQVTFPFFRCFRNLAGTSSSTRTRTHTLSLWHSRTLLQELGGNQQQIKEHAHAHAHSLSLSHTHTHTHIVAGTRRERAAQTARALPELLL